MNLQKFNPGEAARIRRSIHSPYSGRTGVVMDFNETDEKGAYLVMFSDGLQFRYRQSELESVGTPPHSRVIETLHRVVSGTREGLRRTTHIG